MQQVAAGLASGVNSVGMGGTRHASALIDRLTAAAMAAKAAETPPLSGDRRWATTPRMPSSDPERGRARCARTTAGHAEGQTPACATTQASTSSKTATARFPTARPPVSSPAEAPRPRRLRRPPNRAQRASASSTPTSRPASRSPAQSRRPGAAESRRTQGLYPAAMAATGAALAIRCDGHRGRLFFAARGVCECLVRWPAGGGLWGRA